MIHTNEPEQRSAAVYSALLDTTQCLNSKHEHLTFALCPHWTGLLQRVNLGTVTAIVSVWVVMLGISRLGELIKAQDLQRNSIVTTDLPLEAVTVSHQLIFQIHLI